MKYCYYDISLLLLIIVRILILFCNNNESVLWRPLCLYTHMMSISKGIIIVSSNTYTFVPSQTVTIPVQLIDSSQINCPYYRNIEVDVNERNALSLLATDTTYQICKGTIFTVNAQPSNLDNYIFKNSISRLI